MRSKDYLNQAFQIEKRIAAKAEQIESLRTAVTKVTTTLIDVKVQGSQQTSRMENIIAKMMDLEEELKTDMDALIAIKSEVMKTIRLVPDPELQLILEKRYLCYEKWEDISIDLNISIQHTFRLHGEALKKIEEILKMRVNERE